MASDAARKDARERSLGGAALRLLALLALAAVVIRTRAVLAAARVGDAVGARGSESARALEHEPLELAARQRAVDAELAAAAPAAPASAPAAPAAPPEAKPRAAAAAAPSRPGDALRDDGDVAPRGRRPTRSSPRTAARRRGATRARRASSGTTGPTRRPARGADLAPGARPRARARASGARPRSARFWSRACSGAARTSVGDARPARHTRAPRGLGPAGSVSWLFTWKAATYVINNPASLDARRHRFCVVFHQVRHPLRVISSVVRATRAHDRFWDWLYGVEPGLDRTDPPVRAGRAALAPPEPAARENRGRRLPSSRRRRRAPSAARRGSPTSSAGATGRHHATSSKVVQHADLEPRRLAGAARRCGCRPRSRPCPGPTWNAPTRRWPRRAAPRRGRLRAGTRRPAYHLRCADMTAGRDARPVLFRC